MQLTKTNLEGVFQAKENDKSRLVTHNKIPGKSVYGEQLLSIHGEEYRVWDPYRSKFAAAYLSGMKKLPQIHDKRILYLGVSTGTTASHFSDILTKERGKIIFSLWLSGYIISISTLFKFIGKRSASLIIQKIGILVLGSTLKGASAIISGSFLDKRLNLPNNL